VIIHDGEREILRYETLVNPEMHIPRNITALTGITNELVEAAPVFKEVAEELHELLKR